MPYNTNAISPREKPTGETCLPCRSFIPASKLAISKTSNTSPTDIESSISSVKGEKDHLSRPRYWKMLHQCRLYHVCGNRKFATLKHV